MSAYKDRAKFKKGQKVIKWEPNPDPNAPDKIIYTPAMIQRGEKRTDPITKESAYFYYIEYSTDTKSKEEWIQEKDIIKYNIDILNGTQSEAANEARRIVEDIVEARKTIEWLSKIPSYLRLKIPHQLKRVLLEDYEKINIQGKYLPIPRTAHSYPTVEDVIGEWKNKDVEGQDEEDKEEEAQVAAGLLSYFNNALYQFLLYQPELMVYEEAIKAHPSLRPSQLYGAEHLVRLFVKLPELISVIFMADGDAQNIVALEEHLHDLMSTMISDEVYSRIFSSAESYQENPHWVVPLNPPLPLSLPPIAPGSNKKQGEEEKKVAVVKNTTTNTTDNKNTNDGGGGGGQGSEKKRKVIDDSSDSSSSSSSDESSSSSSSSDDDEDMVDAAS